MSHTDGRSTAMTWAGWGLLAALLAPLLAAIAWYPAFVTQDGPAHAYNAAILLDALAGRDGGPFAKAYRVQWVPLPNWAGHLTLAGLMAGGLSPRTADRIVMGLTLSGFAAGTLVLRRRVAGTSGSGVAAALATLLAANVMWLYGFYGYLMGAMLFGLTLAIWWAGRDRPGPAWASKLGLLLAAGYLAHPVSLGLTAVGLVVLTLATPAHDRRAWLGRAGWTAAGLLPLVPLAVVYVRIMGQGGGGGLAPVWVVLTDPFSPAAWARQLGWIDPISLGSRLALPFVGSWRRPHAAASPVLWTIVGLGLLAAATRAVRGPIWRDERRGFAALALLLLAGGVAGPDALGHNNGHFLAQRVGLLGLVSLVPWLDLGATRRSARLGRIALAVALCVQTGFVWDYARQSQARVGPIVAAGPIVGTGQRVGAVWARLRQPFRPNPLTHADCLLGPEAGNVVWGNYESAHYYFPVRVRDDVPHPPVLEFEAISIRDTPAQAQERAGDWSRLLEVHHGAIDRIVIWGDDLALETATARLYQPIGQSGPVRVYAPATPLGRRTEAMAEGALTR
jgi:hypothetical protein